MDSATYSFIGIGHVLADNFAVERPEHPNSTAFSELALTLGEVRHVDSITMRRYLSKLGEAEAQGALKQSWRIGGGAAIVSCLLSQCGWPVRLDATTGSDDRGRWLLGELASKGVRCSQTAAENDSGIFVSFTAVDGRSSIFVNPGAAREIRDRSLDFSTMREGGIIFIDGLLADAEAWLVAIAEKAKAANLKIALDLSTPGNAREHGEFLAEFAGKHCEFVFANDAEYELILPSLAGKASGETLWVVKKGALGAVLIGKHGCQYKVAAHPTVVKNLVGAGDAFAAGFLHAYLRGWAISDCMERGAMFAGAMIAASDHLPTVDEIENNCNLDK